MILCRRAELSLTLVLCVKLVETRAVHSVLSVYYRAPGLGTFVHSHLREAERTPEGSFWFPSSLFPLKLPSFPSFINSTVAFGGVLFTGGNETRHTAGGSIAKMCFSFHGCPITSLSFPFSLTTTKKQAGICLPPSVCLGQKWTMFQSFPPKIYQTPSSTSIWNPPFAFSPF